LTLAYYAQVPAPLCSPIEGAQPPVTALKHSQWVPVQRPRYRAQLLKQLSFAQNRKHIHWVDFQWQPLSSLALYALFVTTRRLLLLTISDVDVYIIL
jgi:hypothetical protein